MFRGLRAVKGTSMCCSGRLNQRFLSTFNVHAVAGGGVLTVVNQNPAVTFNHLLPSTLSHWPNTVADMKHMYLLDNSRLIACYKPPIVRQHCLIERMAEFVKNTRLRAVLPLPASMSGVLLLSKTPSMLTDLCDQLKQLTVEMQFICLVEGALTEELILLDRFDRSLQIAHITGAKVGNDRLGVLIVSPLQAPLRCVAGKLYTVVSVHQKGNFIHQLRLQLSHHGFPIVGDIENGSTVPFFEGLIGAHLMDISYIDHVQGKRVSVNVPPPQVWNEKYPSLDLLALTRKALALAPFAVAKSFST
jgi:hypothetical protein